MPYTTTSDPSWPCRWPFRRARPDHLGALRPTGSRAGPQPLRPAVWEAPGSL